MVMYQLEPFANYDLSFLNLRNVALFMTVVVGLIYVAATDDKALFSANLGFIGFPASVSVKIRQPLRCIVF